MIGHPGVVDTGVGDPGVRDPGMGAFGSGDVGPGLFPPLEVLMPKHWWSPWSLNVCCQLEEKHKPNLRALFDSDVIARHKIETWTRMAWPGM